MENDWEYLHGRVNPGKEASLDLVESVDTKAPRRLEPQRQHTVLEDIEEDVSQDTISREKTLSGVYPPQSLLSAGSLAAYAAHTSSI
jgi:hypothetical protein